MSSCVLDASALLAFLNQEPGGEKVRSHLPTAVMSAVNFCETVQGLRRQGIPTEEIALLLRPLVPTPVPFDEPLAFVAASLHERTRGQGLSLGDCACLGLALSLGIPAVTAERSWSEAEIGVSIITIR